MPISKPKVTFNIIPDNAAVANEPQRVLFVGQKTTAGSATPGQLVTSIENGGQENTLFGENSMLAAMIRAAKRINKISRFDAIPLADNGSGVKAAGSIAFTGPSTEAGELVVTVGSDRNHKYTLTIANGDSATAIGDALVTAITADTKAPVTAVNTTGSVAITAVNAGTEGNAIGLRVEGTVAGVGVTVTALTAGATNPTLTGLFDVIENQRYQTIVYPASYDLTVLLDLLDNRFNVTNNVLDGVGLITKSDTLSNLKTLGNARNSQSLTIVGVYKVNETLFKAPAILELDYVINAQVGATRALRLTDNANLARYTISNNGARDSFGGAASASLPYYNTPLYDLPVTKPNHDFDDTEQDELNAAGVSVIGNNIANNQVIFGEFVTTYKTDAGGNPDTSYKYLNTIDTASNVREYFFRNLKATYAQTRLTDGDVVPNRNMANAEIISAYLVSLYTDLAGEDYVLTQAGEAARKFFIENTSVTVDVASGSASIITRPPLVGQLREITATMQITFSTNSTEA